MRFIRSYSQLILKTVGFQIVISLLGMMLGTATGSYSALRLIGAACAVLCYFYIVGSQFWTKGSEDAVDVETKVSPLGGVGAAILAFLPSVVCVLICYFVPMADAAGNSTWSFALFAVTKLVFMGAYFGFAQLLYPTTLESTSAQVLNASQMQSGFFALCTIPALVVCVLCYFWGCKGINPFGMFGDEKYKNGSK